MDVSICHCQTNKLTHWMKKLLSILLKSLLPPHRVSGAISIWRPQLEDWILRWMHHKGLKRMSISILRQGWQPHLNTYSKYTQDDKKYDLKEVPVMVICDLKEYQFPCVERVHCLFKLNQWKEQGIKDQKETDQKSKSSNQCTEKWPPHCLDAEIVVYLLWRKD